MLQYLRQNAIIIAHAMHGRQSPLREAKPVQLHQQSHTGALNLEFGWFLLLIVTTRPESIMLKILHKMFSGISLNFTY